MEQALLSVHKHRHHNGSGPHADHGHPALGVGGQAVGTADSVADHGPFRENQQIVSGLDGLDGGLHGLDIVIAPLTGNAPTRFKIQPSTG